MVTLTRRVILCLALVLIIITLSSFTATSDTVSAYTSKLPSFPLHRQDNGDFRRKIWQTSHNTSKYVDPPLRANVIKWHHQNPLWQYEMLTDEECDRYVERRYREEPSIVEAFTGLNDRIIRADLFRYLVLLGDGGVYSDMDTECLKPIDDWIPAQYKKDTNVVLGVEYDTYGGDKGQALLDLQLANWTLMAKKGHDLLRLTVQRSLEALAALTGAQNVPIGKISASFNDVLASAGPAQLTLSTWEYLSAQLGEDFGWRNVSGLQEPMLVGDVLLLPVTSFGNGQTHSKSRPKTDKEALVHHQFSGTWKKESHAYKNMDKNAQGHLKIVDEVRTWQ